MPEYLFNDDNKLINLNQSISEGQENQEDSINTAAQDSTDVPNMLITPKTNNDESNDRNIINDNYTDATTILTNFSHKNQSIPNNISMKIISGLFIGAGITIMFFSQFLIGLINVILGLFLIPKDSHKPKV